ncbi:CHD8 protein, partial [Atractosteus spatula]|nr:CHD8 protein [Atractosteus spatula]
MEQLERDKRIHQKLKRFKTKMAQMRHLFQEDEEPFNPDYVEVDRILDESHSVDKDNGEPVVYYLVKWCSLPYEDSTWELKEDVDEGKVLEFKKIQSRQPCLKRVPRPPASAWKKLDLSREYKNGNTLREYQLEGVNWLLFNWYNRTVSLRMRWVSGRRSSRSPCCRRSTAWGSAVPSSSLRHCPPSPTGSVSSPAGLR